MSNLEDMARAANAKCNMTADEMFDSLIEGIKREGIFIKRLYTMTQEMLHNPESAWNQYAEKLKE